MTNTVRMTCDGEPAAADVHPSEVEHWSDHGWVRLDADQDDDAGDKDDSGSDESPDEIADEPAPTDDTTRWSVSKVVDGTKNHRASKSGLTRAKAEAYVAARPSAEYVIEPDGA